MKDDDKLMPTSCGGMGHYKDLDNRELFKNCHCPMDNVMMCKVKYEFPIVLFTGSWSQIDLIYDEIPVQYESFKNHIKDLAVRKEIENGDGKEIYPIEVDYIYFDM